jgi:methionine sulfoxide reductase heme-binding subunit
MEDKSKSSRLGGWQLTCAVAAAILLAAGAMIIGEPNLTEGLRSVIRMTARISLSLFLLAFVASAVVRLLPSGATRWLVCNRRYVGLAFAFSHGVHLVAIVMLARTDPETFHRLTNVVSYVGGGLGYIFIVLMVLTSFDWSAALLGRRAWRLLHTVGMWYLCLSFALNFGKRIPLDAGYAGPVVLVGIAIALRLLALKRARASAAPAG